MSAWAAVLSGLRSARINVEGSMESERITYALEKIADQLKEMEERNGEQGDRERSGRDDVQPRCRIRTESNCSTSDERESLGDD